MKRLERIFRFVFGLVMLLAVVTVFGDRTAACTGEPAVSPQPEISLTPSEQDMSVPFLPIYHIPLNVHLNKSARRAAAFTEILEEINYIWRSQAGICFEMTVVMTDVKSRGFDIWFVPRINDSDSMNGIYSGGHSIYVRDTPILRAAPRPAQHPAARTAAHELGHALGLPHRQDSDDNLMRSKTFGWRLNKKEVAIARRAAASRAIKDNVKPMCGPIEVKP